jgi:hypothetical protein
MPPVRELKKLQRSRWETLEYGNSILGDHDEEVFVSYNPDVKESMERVRLDPFGEALARVARIVDDISGASEESGEETALLVDDVWYILQGDFREEYTAAYPDKESCLAVYNKHKKKYRSLSSTDDE